MKWYIVGGGSIGRLLAASLSRSKVKSVKSDIFSSKLKPSIKNSTKLSKPKKEDDEVILLLREKGRKESTSIKSSVAPFENTPVDKGSIVLQKKQAHKKLQIHLSQQYKEVPFSFISEVKYENVSPSTSNASHLSKIERLIVTTKAYDVFSAIQALQDRLSRNAVIIILANGKGFYDKLFRFDCFQSMTFVTAIVDHGAMIPEFPCTTTKNHRYREYKKGWEDKKGIGEAINDPSYSSNKVLCVNHTGKGSILIGLCPSSIVDDEKDRSFPTNLKDSKSNLLLNEIQTFFNYSVDLNCIIVPNIEKLIWRKFCANICINGLTTLYEIKNGDILHDIRCRYIITHLCYEVSALVNLEFQKNFSNNEENILREFEGPSLEEYVLEIARKTARNESSMFRDYIFRRKTELENLHGYMIQLQKSKYGHILTLPITNFLYNLLSKKITKN